MARANTPPPKPLAEVVKDAYERSPLYQAHWKRHGFDPMAGDYDLREIPPITKTDMRTAPFEERVQFPETEGYYFPTISGGTTAEPTMSFMSAYALAPYYRYAAGMLKNPPTSVFMLRPPIYASAMLGAVISSEYFPRGTRITLGDSKDLGVSGPLAKAVHADMLHTRPSDAIRFVRILRNAEYDPSHIRFIWLTGEPITRAAITLVESLYPNAIVLYSYAMTEGPCAMGLRTSRCDSLTNIGVNAYHLNTTDYHFEVVDGVLVATALHILPTPLIRFVVGDRARIEDTHTCSCGYPPGPVVAVGPRAGLSSYKLGGFTFQSEGIRTTLAKLDDFVTGEFRLTLAQRIDGERLVTELALTVRPTHTPTPFMRSEILNLLRTELVVAGTQTLGTAERLGRISLASLTFDNTIRGEEIRPPAETLV